MHVIDVQKKKYSAQHRALRNTNDKDMNRTGKQLKLMTVRTSARRRKDNTIDVDQKQTRLENN